MLDQFYPLDDLVAVIDERPAAERAVQALKDNGVPDSDVDLVDGAWFAQAARSAVQNRGVVKRLAHLLPTDESLLARRYVDEAEQQHVIIVVHAPSQDDVERAREILAAHGAREMHHYERRVIRDL
jgi:ABC-type branched-subunit amino acid transport system substrate-binding protein